MLNPIQHVNVNKCIGDVSFIAVNQDGDNILVGGTNGGLSVMSVKKDRGGMFNPKSKNNDDPRNFDAVVKNKSPTSRRYKTKITGIVFSREFNIDTGEVLDPKVIGLKIMKPTRTALPFVIACERHIKLLKYVEKSNWTNTDIIPAITYDLVDDMEPFRTMDADSRMILTSNFNNIFTWDIEYYNGRRTIQRLDGFGCPNYYGLIYTTARYFEDMIFYGTTSGQVFYGKKSDPWMSLGIEIPESEGISENIVASAGKRISSLYYNPGDKVLTVRTPYYLVSYDVRNTREPINSVPTIPEKLMKDVNITGYNKMYTLCGCGKYMCTEGCSVSRIPTFLTYMAKFSIGREYPLTNLSFRRKNYKPLTISTGKCHLFKGGSLLQDHHLNLQLYGLDCSSNGDVCVCGWDDNILIYERNSIL